MNKQASSAFQIQQMRGSANQLQLAITSHFVCRDNNNIITILNFIEQVGAGTVNICNLDRTQLLNFN